MLKYIQAQSSYVFASALYNITFKLACPYMND